MAMRLFLVHGMGTFGTDWATDIEQQLDTLYANYPKLASVSRKTRFVIHPVRYDDVLSNLVTGWQANSTAVSKLAKGVSASLAEALVGWLKTAGAGFEWTHAADVLLYRCFSDVREAVLVHVGKQIATAIDADIQAGQVPRWAVLAHSLGTAVTHDTLHAMWTTGIPGGSGFDPANIKARFVMMIANVSRVLETDVDVLLDSTVKPGTAASTDRGALRYVTARHRLDPFTIPRMFDPQDWPDAATVNQKRYTALEVSHIHDRNVHGFSHYLKDPAIHIPLFRLLADQASVIGKAEEAAALAAFPALGLANALVEQKRLELMQPSRSDEWKALRQIWDAFFGL